MFIMPIKTIFSSLLCFSMIGCGSVPCRPAAEQDISAVQQVVESFQASIVRKDKPMYMSLFFSGKPEEIGWQAVVDDEKLAKIQRTRPQAIKARHIPTNSFVSLIDNVVSSKTSEEERVSNLSVDTDGEIASASFDYAYLSDGSVMNWGREHWQLVRTEHGWKIFSVVYTIRDPRS